VDAHVDGLSSDTLYVDGLSSDTLYVYGLSTDALFDVDGLSNDTPRLRRSLE